MSCIARFRSAPRRGCAVGAAFALAVSALAGCASAPSDEPSPTTRTVSDRETATPSPSPSPTATTDPTDPATWVIDSGGIGPVRLGMTEAELAGAGVPGLDVQTQTDPVLPPKGCLFASAYSPDVDGLRMEAGGVVDRGPDGGEHVHWVGLSSPGPRTAQGIGVGSTVEEVRTAYPDSEYRIASGALDQAVIIHEDGRPIEFVTVDDAAPSDLISDVMVGLSNLPQSTCPGLF